MLWIIWNCCQTIYCLSCIRLLFCPYLTIVILFGWLHLLQFLSLWNVCILDFCWVYLCVAHLLDLLWWKGVGFIQPYRCLRSFTDFVQPTWGTGLSMLRQIQDVVDVIKVTYIFHKFKLQLVKIDFYRGAVTWNNLPPEAKTLSRFRSTFAIVLIHFCCL